MRFDVLEEDVHAARIRELFTGRLRSDKTTPYAPTTVVVCFTNRCGSTYVCSALSELGLAGAPNSHLNYEYLNHDAVAEYQQADGHESFEDYLRWCSGHHRGRAGAWTLKASVRQLNFLIETDLLWRMSPRVVFIRVRRRNVVAQAVSLWTAAQDGRWTSLHGPATAGDLVLDEIAVLKIVRQVYEDNSAFDMLFELHGITPVEVWYEDFADRPDLLRGWLSDSVGLPVAPVGPSSLPVERQASYEKVRWERKVRDAATEATGRLGH